VEGSIYRSKELANGVEPSQKGREATQKRRHHVGVDDRFVVRGGGAGGSGKETAPAGKTGDEMGDSLPPAGYPFSLRWAPWRGVGVA
jgi:hypothetical protein